MKPARWPRSAPLDERLLVLDPHTGSCATDSRVGALPEHLRAGDLLVVNDAATLPASLPARSSNGATVEVRLLAPERAGALFRAVLFGAGDWRTPTEHRPPPPALVPGDTLDFHGALTARIVSVSALSPRLVSLAFDRADDALFAAVYALGRPVQYSHLAGDLSPWHVQTAFAARPWASEMPSAGRPLTWELLRALRQRGVLLARVTHAAGLAATGDPALDAALPLPERYDIPASTVTSVRAARSHGGRIVAVGTTVVRALEGCAASHDGALTAGAGTTDLVLHSEFIPRVVHGLLTGLHDPSTSHFALLRAFAPEAMLEQAYRRAESAGYLAHEFGDTQLILAA